MSFTLFAYEDELYESVTLTEELLENYLPKIGFLVYLYPGTAIYFHDGPFPLLATEKVVRVSGRFCGTVLFVCRDQALFMTTCEYTYPLTDTDYHTELILSKSSCTFFKRLHTHNKESLLKFCILELKDSSRELLLPFRDDLFDIVSETERLYLTTGEEKRKEE